MHLYNLTIKTLICHINVYEAHFYIKCMYWVFSTHLIHFSIIHFLFHSVVFHSLIKMARQNWILPRFADDYRREKVSDRREYNAGLRHEWDYRMNESNALHDDLTRLKAPLADRVSLTMQLRNMVVWTKQICIN